MTRGHLASAGFLVMVMAASCTPNRQYAVQGAERAAGADGSIHIEQQEGGNWMVQLEVQNLLPPSRLGEGLTTYVVWFQESGQQPMRVGVLQYEEGDRRGEMSATTTFEAFQLILTGETEAGVPSPSEHVVFRTAVESPS